jgi:predicted Fe-Mo cluster-binding NifX family protein
MSNEEKKLSGKIAVATNDNQKVAGHVGKCKAFLVFETDGSKILDKVIRINSFTNHGKHHDHNEEQQPHHGEGHHHHHGEGQGQHNHHNLVDGLKDCDALIFNHGGWRMIEDLKAHNIKPILTNEVLAEDAVLKYLSGDLIISEENVCSGHQH